MKYWLKITAVFVLFSVLIPLTAVYFPKIAASVSALTGIGR